MISHRWSKLSSIFKKFFFILWLNNFKSLSSLSQIFLFTWSVLLLMFFFFFCIFISFIFPSTACFLFDYFLWFVTQKLLILFVYFSFDTEFTFCIFLELLELYWNSYFEFFTWYITDFHVSVCGYCDPLIVLLYFDFSYKFCIAVFALEVAVTSLSLYCLWCEK